MYCFSYSYELYHIPMSHVIIPIKKRPPIPLKKIGKTRRATIFKKHIYFHCRSTLR